MLRIAFLNDDDFAQRVLADLSDSVKPVFIVSGDSLPDKDTKVLLAALEVIFDPTEIIGLDFVKNIKIILKLEEIAPPGVKFSPPSLAILKHGHIPYCFSKIGSDMHVVVRLLALQKPMIEGYNPAPIAPAPSPTTKSSVPSPHVEKLAIKNHPPTNAQPSGNGWDKLSIRQKIAVMPIAICATLLFHYAFVRDNSRAAANYPLMLSATTAGPNDLQFVLRNPGDKIITGWKVSCDLLWANKTKAYSKSLAPDEQNKLPKYVIPGQPLAINDAWSNLTNDFAKRSELDASLTACSAVSTDIKATNTQNLPLKADFTYFAGRESVGELFGVSNVSGPTIVKVTLTNTGTKDFVGPVKIGCMQVEDIEAYGSRSDSTSSFSNYYLKENLKVSVMYSTGSDLAIRKGANYTGDVVGDLRDAKSATTTSMTTTTSTTSTACWIQ